MSGADGGESCEELLNMLHQRMISTGEWSSLLVQLRRMLEESGWEAQLREQAERTELLRTSKVIHILTLRRGGAITRFATYRCHRRQTWRICSW